MLDTNDLLAISELMDNKLKPINDRLDSVDTRLDKMQEDLDILKENSKVTRNAVNTLLDWAEEAQIEVKIPLYKR